MRTNTNLRTIVLATLAMAIPFAGAQAPNAPQVSPEQKKAVLDDMERIITKNAYVPGVDFAKWPDLVKRHQAKIDEAKDQFAFTMVMNQALQEFGFSHIVLFSPQAATARSTRKTVGLGVRIQPDPKGLKVVYVFPGTPADTAGMKPGDLIVAGDGKPIKSTTDLQGEEGTKVKVTVERGGKQVNFDITRKIFSTDIPETLTWVDKDTAMLTIPTFDMGYKAKRVAELMVDAQKAKNFILDLRGNGGGAVVNLLNLASYFFDPGTPIGTFVNRKVADEFNKETGKPATDAVSVASWAKDKLHTSLPHSDYYSGKIVVLIDGGTGSASEMMAAALRENKGARLIGSKSAGAVLASLMWPIKENYLLQYPLMDYVTIKGLRLEGNGLKPDDAAPTPAIGAEDKALALAHKWFTSTD